MRTFSAGGVLAAVLFVAGCGGGGGGGNGNSTQTSSLATKSPSAVLHDTSKAVESANSFHMAGLIRSSSSSGPFGSAGHSIGLDLTIVPDKGATGSMTIGGTKVDLIVVGKNGYLRASPAFWQKYAKQAGGGQAASFAATLFGNKWLKFPAGNKDFGALTDPTKANSLFKSLTSNNGKLENQGETTYKGQSVVAIQSSKKNGTLYVGATGTPYPVALTKTGGKTGGAVTFDSWNQPVKLTAPQGALDLSQFGG